MSNNKPSEVSHPAQRKPLLAVLSSKHYINADRNLDDIEQVMRDMDSPELGYLSNEKMDTILQQQIKTQEELFNIKRLLTTMAGLTLMLVLSNLGTSYAAARVVAKDAQVTSDGILVITNDMDKVVGVQIESKVFPLTNNGGERWLELIEDDSTAVANDFTIAFEDAQALSIRCTPTNTTATSYIFFACDGANETLPVCGSGIYGAMGYNVSTGPMDETLHSWSYLDSRVAIGPCDEESGEGCLVTYRQTQLQCPPRHPRTGANTGGEGGELAPPGTDGPPPPDDGDGDITVQGGSLQTWPLFPAIERVQIFLSTEEGRPLNANVELRQGPDNIPQKMVIYSEDGALRPFNCIVKTPPGQANAIVIQNTAPSISHSLSANVDTGLSGPIEGRLSDGGLETVQGGAIKTYTLEGSAGSIAVLIKTYGRPLNSRIELLQGPNNNKQVINLYTEDGLLRPFYAIIETPGTGNVIRLTNTATLESTMLVSVQPYSVEQL